MDKQFFDWDYSINSDILNIHKKNKKTKGSAELGDFTVDFDENDNVIGIEIMHAVEFFKELDVTKEQLKNIKKAIVLVNKRNPSYTLIYIRLELQNKIVRTIPIPAPVYIA